MPDARRLAQRFRAMAGERLAGFNAQGRHLHVVQLGRQAQFFVICGALHLALLAVDVAGVLGGNLHLLDHRALKSPSVSRETSALAYLPPSMLISAS
jgi:hypothetical protein